MNPPRVPVNGSSSAQQQPVFSSSFAGTTSLSAQELTSDTASQQTHGSNNLYACRDCGRSYSRPEHLVRHVQTHTLGRRFACEICQKSFARKDLLRRHVANHENDSPQKRRRTTSSPGAGRVSQACRPCAVARVKCDDSKPCRRCVNRKLTCVSSEAGPSSNLHHHMPTNTHVTAAQEVGHSAVTAYSTESVNTSSPASHGQAHPALGGLANGLDPSIKTTTPYSQTTSCKPEENQLPTPETVVDQGTCPRSYLVVSTLRPC